MTALSYPRSRLNLFPFLVFVAVVILGYLMLASTHAVITHGQAAMDAQRCFSGGGQVMNLFLTNPFNGRVMKFCNDHGRWYVSIEDSCGDNITCFPRSPAKCMSDCVDYGTRTGFTVKEFIDSLVP